MTEPKVFQVISVTEDVHYMLRDVEEKAIDVMLAECGEDVEEAYACLSYSRKFLYEYIEDLERLAEVCPNIPRTYLRFT